MVVAVVVAVVVAALMVLVVVEESHGMILCLKKVRFSHLLKRRDLRTDEPKDGQTLLWRCEDASKKGQRNNKMEKVGRMMKKE